MIFDLEAYEQCKAAQRMREQQAKEAPPEPEGLHEVPRSAPPRFAVRSVAEWLEKRKWEPHLTYAQRNAQAEEPEHETEAEADEDPQEIVRDWLKVHLRHKEIIKEVADEAGVTVDDIISHSRKQIHVIPRRKAMYEVAKAYPTFSWPRLGSIFNRDHSTTITAVRKYCKLHNLPLPKAVN